MTDRIKDMVDSIAEENFDNAREALKSSLAEYMAGKRFLTNEEVYGNGGDPREDVVEESMIYTNNEGEYKCNACGEIFDTTDHHHAFLDGEGSIMCPSCGSTDVEEYDEEMSNE